MWFWDNMKKKASLDPHGKCNITKFGQEVGEVYECFRLNSYSGNISGCYDHHEGQLEWDTIVFGLFCRSVHLLLASSTDEFINAKKKLVMDVEKE